ncbi:peptide deformylase [Vagococcus coleopterorum]|uniref:Peptide deformylase n=1 Tax=Vagococcus coleopterorum TaxID=2714946 RepID=A0A6G8ALG3_9ENTE|nr:peptide deformylase [Vagococcus coleopterorum]QIL45799.1 peptide deformylase [Vagococcus coleopterorum]
MIKMNNIIREGHPTLREKVPEVTLPLSVEDKALGEAMMTFLKNSQDPEIAEKYNLRGGVGLAAPQLDEKKRMVAVHVPSLDPEDETPLFSDVLINPEIVSHTVQQACLRDGEGCLSVDREVPGYIVRNARITVNYIDLDGNTQTKKFKNYEAIVVQHELDHLNGIMFYDHINKTNPFAVSPDVLIIG